MAKETRKNNNTKVTMSDTKVKESDIVNNIINLGPRQPKITTPTGVCHLLECTCILPQYLNTQKPVFHKFRVFSIIDEDDKVEEKFVQCNNCGIVHKIIDICKSQVIHGKEELANVVTIKDIKLSFPQRLAEVIDDYKCEVYVWEHAKFILDSERWGSYVVLNSEELEGKKVGKFLVINSADKFGISTFEETVEYSTN